MRNEILSDILILAGLAMMVSGLWVLYGWPMVTIFCGFLCVMLGSVMALRRAK